MTRTGRVLIVRNTFLDIASCDVSRRSGAGVRPMSMPAMRRSKAEPCDGCAAEQLRRMESILFGERCSGAPGAPEAFGRGAPERVPSVGSEVEGVGAQEPRGPLAGPSAGPPEGPSLEAARLGAPELGREVGASFPTVGSVGHSLGACRPCAFVGTPAGCNLGAHCKFCHVLVHSAADWRRPCKMKRGRIRQTLAVVEATVAQEPEFLASGVLSLTLDEQTLWARACHVSMATGVAAEASSCALQDVASLASGWRRRSILAAFA